MFEALFGVEAKRRRLLRHCPLGPVHDYLSQPFPDPSGDIDDTPMVALDLETSGFDPVQHDILSVGLVNLQHGRIELATARHQIVQARAPIPEETAAIHRITDDMSSDGAALVEVVASVLRQLAGRVMLAHHASIERTFLEAACERLYGVRPVFAIVDTERVIRRWMERRNKIYKPGDLRLFNLRDRFGLPRYAAHNALYDALATAELFIAWRSSTYGEAPLPLKRIMNG